MRCPRLRCKRLRGAPCSLLCKLPVAKGASQVDQRHGTPAKRYTQHQSVHVALSVYRCTGERAVCGASSLMQSSAKHAEPGGRAQRRAPPTNTSRATAYNVRIACHACVRGRVRGARVASEQLSAGELAQSSGCECHLYRARAQLHERVTRVTEVTLCNRVLSTRRGRPSDRGGAREPQQSSPRTDAKAAPHPTLTHLTDRDGLALLSAVRTRGVAARSARENAQAGAHFKGGV